VLAPSGMLVEHALAEEQQHNQPNRHRRLHHHERGKQQSHHLQGPAEQRQARSRQPACPPQEVQRERGMQVLGVGSALGVHRLQHHP